MADFGRNISWGAQMTFARNRSLVTGIIGLEILAADARGEWLAPPSSRRAFEFTDSRMWTAF